MDNRFFLQQEVSLKTLNTFGINTVAAYYVEIHNLIDLYRIYQDEKLRNLPRLILGGGSNVLLVSERFNGLVLRIINKGISIERDDGQAVYIRVYAGEKWHDFVQWTLQQGYPGLENLSFIPGTVGAAPIQNIGAYGAEMKDHFYSLRAFDFQSGQVIELDREDCAFSYRDSIFKHVEKNRFVITDITFALPRKWIPNIKYKDISDYFANKKIDTPTAKQISQAVVEIRQHKLPNPALQGNAGSFFQNPTVTAEDLAALKLKFPTIPAYAQSNGTFRIAAGWLIDQCGWKGKRLGNAGVCATQALVLINCGDAKGEEIAELARTIQDDVYKKFGIQLVPEPDFIN